MNNLTELKIWSKSINLTVAVYKATENYPNEERFGLISQSRRSAVSIPSNIAEGAGRNTSKEFNNFLGIANGSCYELQTQLIVANRLKLLKDAELAHLLTQIDELQKMNYGLQKMLKTKSQI